MDEFAEQYCCGTARYLISMLEHRYNIIIDHGVGAPGYVIEVIDGLNYNKFCRFKC